MGIDNLDAQAAVVVVKAVDRISSLTGSLPKLGRLFRSALHALTAVEDLPKLGVSQHLPDLGGDIGGNGLAKLFLTFAAAFAEAQRHRSGSALGR